MNIKRILTYIVTFIIGPIAIILFINFYVLSFSGSGYFEKNHIPPNNFIGLVFWASVKQNGDPSDILKDRLKGAYSLYKQGNIEKIIVSGDNSTLRYNEPVAMQKYLMKLGVDQEDIYLDYAGFDTYDSLYRAKEIFWVKSITLFTQDFHLKRAMYISKRLGIHTYGYETNLQRYVLQDYNNRREIFARVKAFLEVEILKNTPRYLWEKITILSESDINRAKSEILQQK